MGTILLQHVFRRIYISMTVLWRIFVLVCSTRKPTQGNNSVSCVPPDRNFSVFYASAQLQTSCRMNYASCKASIAQASQLHVIEMEHFLVMRKWCNCHNMSTGIFISLNLWPDGHVQSKLLELLRHWMLAAWFSYFRMWLGLHRAHPTLGLVPLWCAVRNLCPRCLCRSHLSDPPHTTQTRCTTWNRKTCVQKTVQHDWSLFYQVTCVRSLSGLCPRKLALLSLHIVRFVARLPQELDSLAVQRLPGKYRNFFQTDIPT